MAKKRISPAEADASPRSQTIIAGPNATLNGITQIFVSGPGKLAEAASELFAGRGLSSSTADASVKLSRELKRRWIDGKLARSLTEGRSAELAFQLLSLHVDPADEALPAPARDAAAPLIGSLGEILEDSSNSLLLLGTVGAGKTTALLLLMREMIESGRSTAEKIPVFLPLRDFAAGAEGQPFEAWIERQLFSHYRIGGDAARALLSEKRLLLLLDALDEAQTPGRCAAAIASFLKRYDADCVVTCRKQVASEANAASLPLRATAAIVPLDDEAIRGYVKALGPAYRPLLKQLGNGSALLALCRLPLMLHLAASTPGGSSGGVALNEDSLIERYFKTGLKVPEPYRAKAIDYLGNLAVLAGPGRHSDYIHVDYSSDGWVGDRWPSKVKFRTPAHDMDAYEAESRERRLKHYARDRALDWTYRFTNGISEGKNRLPSIIRRPWFSILRLVERVRFRIGEWRTNNVRASRRIPFGIRLSLRLIEIIASLLAMFCASIFVALIITAVSRATSFNGWELLKEPHFGMPIMLISFWSALLSKQGRGWRLGSSVGTFALSWFIILAFLALLIGVFNWIVWRAQWLIPIVLIAFSTLLSRLSWKETTDKIARMREVYEHSGGVEETPAAWIFRSRELTTTVITKPSFRNPEFWIQAAVAMVYPALAFGIIRLFGGDVSLGTSLAGYSLTAGWLWVNIVAAGFAVSLVYFLYTRFYGVFPWRMTRFVNALVREGVLERDGKNIRVEHARIHEFLRIHAPYIRLD